MIQNKILNSKYPSCTSPLFLFSTAKDKSSRLINDGCLIAILNPKIMPQKESYESKSDYKVPAISVNQPTQIIVLGSRCEDFGYCHGQNWSSSKDGFKKASSSCKNFVNLAISPLCQYHVTQSSKSIASKRGIFNTTAKPVVKKDPVYLKKDIRQEEKTFIGEKGRSYTIDTPEYSVATNPENSSNKLKFKSGSVQGGSKAFNKQLNAITPGALQFQKLLKQKSEKKQPQINSINRTEIKKIVSQNSTLTASQLREAAKKQVKTEVKNSALKNDRIAKLLERVNKNRTTVKKEEKPLAKFDKSLLTSKSKYSGLATIEEQRAQDFYFSILEARDKKLLKDLSTTQTESKTVTCHTCKYTFWSPHDNCRKNNHKLTWKVVTKRFFDCKCGNGRSVTWHHFPTVKCSACGENNWTKGGAAKNNLILQSDKILISGDDPKWLNSLN